MRLRSTESLTLFLPITSPRRGCCRSFSRASSRTFLPGTLPEGESKTALNWRGVSRRFSRPKPRLTTCSDIRRSDAYGLWRDGGTELDDRSWWPCGHGSHGYERVSWCGYLVIHCGPEWPPFKRPAIVEKLSGQVNFQPVPSS